MRTDLIAKSLAIECIVMKSFRLLITALALGTIATNPVAAAIVRCCCKDQQKPALTCCEQDKALSDEPLACCAEAPGTSKPFEIHKNCCCESASPLLPVRDPARTSFQLSQPLTADLLAVVSDPAPSKFLRPIVGEQVPSHPPLQILYCTWLK